MKRFLHIRNSRTIFERHRHIHIIRRDVIRTLPISIRPLFTQQQQREQQRGFTTGDNDNNDITPFSDQLFDLKEFDNYKSDKNDDDDDEDGDDDLIMEEDELDSLLDQHRLNETNSNKNDNNNHNESIEKQWKIKLNEASMNTIKEEEQVKTYYTSTYESKGRPMSSPPNFQDIIPEFGNSPGTGSRYSALGGKAYRHNPPLYFAGLPFLHNVLMHAVYDEHDSSVLCVNTDGTEYKYLDIMLQVNQVHKFLVQFMESRGGGWKENERIVFLCPPGHTYIISLFSIWSSGSVAIPLSPTSHTPRDMEYILQDIDPILVIDGLSAPSDPTIGYDSNHDSIDPQHPASSLYTALLENEYLDRVVRISDILLQENESRRELEESEFGDVEFEVGQDGFNTSVDHPAMIVYTSGTTGKPKGVVSTHRAIAHQVTDLVSAWEWSNEDRILHFLPLHHVHGIVNKLCCAVWSGATIEFMNKFDAKSVWQRFSDFNKPPITVFMAVPTIYAKLIEAVENISISGKELALAVEGMESLRLVVSGSAAMPVSIAKKWEKLTKHRILERYGMTEFGMALSNPYHEDETIKRLPGYVGKPLNSVHMLIFDEESGEPLPLKKGYVGELRIKGENVFKEYWKKPDATKEAFDSQGYFKTGDIAEYDNELDSFRILGRSSVDIIKSAGYKISALEIEREILNHPGIEEAVVFGIDDESYGEQIALLYRAKNGVNPIDEEDLINWCKLKLSPYKVPRLIKQVEDIPKNAMGKVNKKELKSQSNDFFRRV